MFRQIKRFKSALAEVNMTITEFFIVDNVVSSLLVYLGFYLVLSLLGLNPLFALIPAILGLVYFVIRSMRKKKMALIESKYSNLNEKLSTASDYKNVDSIMANELKTEVLKDLDSVAFSSFFNEKKLFWKSVVAIILCFGILLAVPFGLERQDLSLILDDILDEGIPLFATFPSRGAGDDGLPGTGGIGEDTALEGIVGDDAEDIFGDAKLARLDSELMQLEIKSIGFEYNIRDVSEAFAQEFETEFPTNIEAVSASTFEENIPKEKQKLVKNYFKELTK